MEEPISRKSRIVDILIVIIVIAAVVLIFAEILSNVFSDIDKRSTELESLRSSSSVAVPLDFFPGEEVSQLSENFIFFTTI